MIKCKNLKILSIFGLYLRKYVYKNLIDKEAKRSLIIRSEYSIQGITQVKNIFKMKFK